MNTETGLIPEVSAQRCQGYRRYGGALTLGPVRWEQCREDASVMLTVRQKDGTSNLPACHTCWREATKTAGIEVLSVKPI